MKLLSIDTSSDVCGVSVLEDTKLLCTLDTNTGKTHSENLIPMINEALEKTNLETGNLDLIVCDIGPGSFTGIRIGVATTRAFSDSLDIPCIGISSLEALAYKAIKENKDIHYACSIIDCNNDNCYFALYGMQDGNLETLVRPQAQSIEDTLYVVNEYCQDMIPSSNITFVGDGSKKYKNKIKATFQNSNFIDSKFDNLDSYALGLAGLEKYNSCDIIPEVLPLYLRKPQAQRQLEEKEEENKITQ